MSLDEMHDRQAPPWRLSIAAMANALLWVLSIVGLIFVMQRCPSAKGLFVVLVGGLAVAVGLIAIVQKRS